VTIDPDSDVPIYRQIAAIICERIEGGLLKPRRPIPSEKQMMQEFEVSRDTIRRVVRYLRDQGVVYTVPQRGTYVSPPAEAPAEEDQGE
jgi:DNA-binding GntR family transcriptional regulator